jgi:hypothetical protein
MLSTFRKFLTLAVLAASVTYVSPARAQGIAVFGGAEADASEQTLLLLGAAWHPNRLGWQPYAAVLGYNLRFGGPTTFTQTVFAPQIGLRYQTAVSGIQLGGGYTFTNSDQPFVSASIESGEGPFGAFQWNHWGTGARSLEAIASYGFDTEFFWSRFTGLQRLTSTSPIHVGGEAGLMGSGGTNNFWTAQFGPVAEWRFTPAFRVGLAGGLRLGLSPTSNDASDAYGRLFFLWLPGLR